MYLQKIEIHGFKSFVNKTRIELNQGITVIVGPNGSGKSNIVDSLRWVLGETSVKSLRGSKLEDVIFSGTKQKRSMGMAEVTVVLNNSSGVFPMEYQEITVTRKVFRDGESQFLINKTPCRLKDVQSLFFDTGLGKNAFAIIGQGRVDHIINASPEERRPLFEEAAGITRYKYRKKEAEQKLEITSQSLQRIEDIIHENTTQLPELKIEADKAASYLDLMKRHDSMEYHYLRSESDKGKKRLETIAEQYERIEKKTTANQVFSAELESQILHLKMRIEQMHERITALSTLSGSIQAETERMRGEEKLNQEQLKNLVNEVAFLKEQKLTLQAEIGSWEEACAALTIEKQEIDSKLAAYERTMQSSTDRIRTVQQDIDLLEAQIKENNSQLFHLQSELARANQNKVKYETRNSFLLKQKEKLNTQCQEKEAKKTEQLQHIETILAKKQTLVQHHEGILAKSDACLQKKKELEAIIETFTHEIQTLENSIQSLHSRLTFLEELEKDLEGYFPGVKSLLVAKKEQPNSWLGVQGIVADLIKVPPDYVLPIEIALGSQLQNIVTLTDEDARSAINFLKEKKSGKATFLPIQSLRSKSFICKDTVKEHPGFIGLASQLIKYDTSVDPVIQFLLGRVLLVTTLKDGLSLAKSMQYAIKIVSLDGQVISPGGSITGGHVKPSGSSILSRKKEIEQLRQDIKPLQDKLMQKKQQLEKNMLALSKTIQDEASIVEQLKTVEEEISMSTREVGQGEERIRSLQEEIDLLQTEMDMLEEGMTENTEAYLQCEKDCTSAELAINECRLSLHKLEENLDKALRTIDEAKNETHREQVDQTRWLQKGEQIQEKIEEYGKRIGDAGQKMMDSQEKIEQNQALIRTTETRAEQINNDIAQLMVKQGMQSDSKNNLLLEKTYAVSKLSQLEKNAAALIETNRSGSQRLHALDLERARIETLLDSIQQTWSEKFSDSFTPVPVDIKNYKQELAQIKEMVQAIGPVNTGAIEHYNKICERTTFLQHQQEDLITAKDSLHKVIREIDDIIEEKFSQTFAQVNREFTAIFSYLFGGGHASLSISNEEDLLRTGVDIEAQPPGKKLQNITLLSGGEKALTAISLLFAFLRIRPSPFCVLDEIESSLDEANEQRFSHFLRELSKQIQFLVVSHRQNTMLAADNLYGITTEEPGVSKIVSVQLFDD